jgi:hypothetical protein
VLSADTQSHDDLTGGSTSGSGSSSQGDPPALAGLVAGKSADASSVLRSHKPILGAGGPLQTYQMPTTEPFMGFPIRGDVTVSVTNGKIRRINGGTDVSSCPQLISKLKAKLGAPASSDNASTAWKGNGWALGVGASSLSCEVIIQTN